MSQEVAVKKQSRVPHTYVILFSIIIMAAIGSYVMTPGVYERSKDERTGRTLVDPNSYHVVERTPVSFFNLFMSVPIGLQKAGSIVFCIFICGGVFTMLQATGAIDAGLGRAIAATRGRESLMIPVTMFVFSIGGMTMGMSEEVIVFVPIGVGMARAMGYDDIVAVSMLSTGAAIGFTAGVLNPFTVGVAQSISELPLFSAKEFRLIGYVFIYAFGVWYTMRYAKMVKNDPTKSYLYGLPGHGADDTKSFEGIEFTGRHKLVLLVAAAGLGAILYGVKAWDWYIDELSTVFLIVGVVGCAVGGVGPSDMARAFVRGCGDIVFGAIVVGISRGILVTLENGKIIDTIIHSLATTVSFLPKGLSAVGMFVVQSIINFFIPSGSGQAATTMPIMAPLSDMIGVTRQTAVMAFHYGDGISNSIIPTSASLMGVLAMAKVPYEKWVKFIWPIMVGWSLIAAVMCYIAAIIDLGPF